MNTNKAMIVIDYQNDFAHPKGSLYVKQGETLVEYINSLMLQTKNEAGIIISSQDWHPNDHISFASRFGIPDYSLFDGNVRWPEHCVKNTWGADFFEGFDKKFLDKQVYKGHLKDTDSYSAFGGIDLDTEESLQQILEYFEIKSLEVVGLATDYCVISTVEEALKKGYAVNLHTRGISAVNVQSTDGTNAIKQMQEKGAKIIY